VGKSGEGFGRAKGGTVPEEVEAGGKLKGAAEVIGVPVGGVEELKRDAGDPEGKPSQQRVLDRPARESIPKDTIAIIGVEGAPVVDGLKERRRDAAESQEVVRMCADRPATVEVNEFLKQEVEGPEREGRIGTPTFANKGSGGEPSIQRRNKPQSDALPAEKEGPDGIQPSIQGSRIEGGVELGRIIKVEPASVGAAAGCSRRGGKKVDLGSERGQSGGERKIEWGGGRIGGKGGKRESIEYLEDGNGQINQRGVGGRGANQLKGFPAGEESTGVSRPKDRIA
jgi:hypothetical protein